MNQLEELKRRVEHAEQQFRLAAEQHRKFGEKLGGVAGAVEGGLRENNAEIERLRAENRQLGEMLTSLLDLVDSSGEDRIEAAVADLDRKVRELFERETQEQPSQGAEEPPKIVTASRSRTGAPRPDGQAADDSGERLSSVKGVLKGMLEEMNAVSVDEDTVATVNLPELAASALPPAEAAPEAAPEEAPEAASSVDGSVAKKVRDALNKIDRSR